MSVEIFTPNNPTFGGMRNGYQFKNGKATVETMEVAQAMCAQYPGVALMTEPEKPEPKAKKK